MDSGGLYNDGMFAWPKKHILAFLLLLGALSLVPAYVRAYNIIGASEIPTVLLGDKIIVNNAAYVVRAPYSSTKLFRTGAPKRGDFVFLRLPNNPRLKLGFFKRIVGLPGETIELRENRVCINGRALPVKQLNPADFAWVPKAHPIGSTVEDEDGHWITFTPGKNEHRNHPLTRLAESQYFLLGDNRDNSFDSREFGPVPADLFLGKVIAILPTGAQVR
ncbi:MAG TPA: signal peptidase I [Acidobacteriota bacterium]|nr:signal peptidase I [Acidobacteriota bacterium]